MPLNAREPRPTNGFLNSSRIYPMHKRKVNQNRWMEDRKKRENDEREKPVFLQFHLGQRTHTLAGSTIYPAIPFPRWCDSKAMTIFNRPVYKNRFE